MLIVKPYGRSEVADPTSDGRRRTLRLRERPAEALDLESFALGHDELVIAQWISVIDKVARKPAAGKDATPAQALFRERLGKASWELLERGGRLSSASDPQRREHLLTLWSWKIAPYGHRTSNARRGRPEPSAKGRWYARFSGGAADVATVDAMAMARRIEAFLHGEEVPEGTKRKKPGLIAARAKSIAANVATPPTPSHGGGYGDAWSDEDERAYAAAGNVALEIRKAAEKREAGKMPGQRQVSPDVAAEALYAHYGRLFRRPDGGTMPIAEARSAHPGLFQLHLAVKDCYARLLARRRHIRSKDAVLAEQRRPTSLRLPATMQALFELVDAKGLNRDLNGLVRLGKVIHYQAAAGGADRTQLAVANWPADIAESHYWTTGGQVEIKRSEAFVRIWRRLLSLASRTLTDWADQKATIGSDILLAKQRERAVGTEFDPAMHRKKLDILFGRRAALFQFADEAEQRALLSFALAAAYRLRNAAFHFTGFGGFAEAVLACCRGASPALEAALAELWQTDEAERSQLGVAIARAAKFDLFWSEEEVSRLVNAAAIPPRASLALPRFSRVLKRAGDALLECDNAASRLFLPTGVELRDAASFCRYQALKLLYEGPFRDWFDTRDAEFANMLIDQAVARATEAAKTLNAGDDERLEELIVARASKLGRLQAGESVADFFFRLSAESASEFRVQLAYQSDRDRARSQADYIEKLKLDVVGLAFGAFLSEQGFDFVLELVAGTLAARSAPFLITAPPYGGGGMVAGWQRALYFLLHLVPVDDVVRLLHQLQRWEGRAAERRETAPLQAVLSLYVDMHDAKFEGGGFVQADAFKEFYESPDDFDRIFPVLGPDELRLCRRGLREILRFGHLQPLRPVFAAQRVSSAQVEDYLIANAPDKEGLSPIARLQAEREALHALWVRKGREFAGADRDRYRAVLNQVVRFRHLSGHVTFISQIRLHRLLVATCSRLVDYSGLWERDLYFVTLAVIHLEGKAPKDALWPAGAHFLGRGQIIEALRRASLSPFAATVLSAHFTEVWKKGSRAVKIRNNIAHFNMLRQGSAPDLTHWLNQTRELLRHDRKLRNAIPASAKELLRQSGLEIAWQLAGEGHHLGPSQLVTVQAQHLKNRSMTEDLNGEDFVAMASALFGDCRPVRPTPPATRPGMGRPFRRDDGRHRRGPNPKDLPQPR